MERDDLSERPEELGAERIGLEPEELHPLRSRLIEAERLLFRHCGFDGFPPGVRDLHDQLIRGEVAMQQDRAFPAFRSRAEGFRPVVGGIRLRETPFAEEERQIGAELAPEGFHLIGTGVFAQHRRGGVPCRDVEEEERQQDHAEQNQHGIESAPDDEIEHNG